MHDVIIIGAGAAGLFLAANLPPSLSVLVVDGNSRPGRKLLITGGGMCNLSTTDETNEFLAHFGSRRQTNFLKPALRSFPPPDTWEWFRSHGLELFFRDDGKVYPASLKAQSVVDVLVDTARSRGVEFAFSSKVEDIHVKEDSFTMMADSQEMTARSTVLATGGMSYPGTGSDGSGYTLAKSLGHSIVPPAPALAALLVEDYQLGRVSGTSVRDTSVSFFHHGESKAYLRTQGDVLFTHDGLSGPAIINASRWCRRGDIVRLNLLGGHSKESAREVLMDSFGRSPARQISSALKEAGLTAELSASILSLCKINPALRCAGLNRETRNKLIEMTVDTPFIISGRKSFSTAMVTSGGIALEEIDRTTMESRRVPGLFCVGEILDVDGDTGGYNLQAAFSMAHLCGLTITARHIIDQ